MSRCEGFADALQRNELRRAICVSAELEDLSDLWSAPMNKYSRMNIPSQVTVLKENNSNSSASMPGKSSNSCSYMTSKICLRRVEWAVILQVCFFS